jgi:hypothetical protein
LVGISEGKTPPGTRRQNWNITIKNYFEGTGRETVDWIYLAQDMDQRRAVVNVVMNLRLP